MPLNSYRYPSEYWILAATLLGVFVILAITTGATLCLAPLLVGVFVFLAYQANRSHHQALLTSAEPFTPQETPGLYRAAADASTRLRIPQGSVQFFMARSRQRNAYTFGLSDPKVVVVYSALLNIMTPEEMRFIIGHELGHVALGHTWLNSLIGGMAGIPAPLEAALLLNLAFRSWNRVCEYSADRAGLLACGSLQSATSALVKLVAGSVRSEEQFHRAMDYIDREDDSPLNLLAESFSTHPLLIRRITQLKHYAASAEFKRLQRSQ